MATSTSNLSSQSPDLAGFKGLLPLVGLTGGIGSGKTAVSNLLAKLGAGIVDTDVIAHQVTAPNGAAIAAIEKQFGSEYIDSTGALDRNKMRALVFAKPEARKALEAITHPLIRQETIKQAQQLAAAGAPYLVFVVPLLIESGSWQGLIDYLVVVDCPEETQIARVMQRSNLSRPEVLQILQAQTSRKDRLAHANAVIENNGTLAQLDADVNRLHQKILQIQKDPPSSS
jgi:dephospho-CoA kinase